MKKKRAFVLVIAVTVFCFAEYSNATVLGTIEYVGAGSNLGELSEMNFSICYPELLSEEFGYDLSTRISWDITEADIGITFWANSQTHETFNDFVSLLTNGSDDLIAPYESYTRLFEYPPGLPVSTKYESELIDIFIGSTVDFEGYLIDSIALTVNELFLNYDADAIKGGLTNFSYDITYTIIGEPIPEPSTVILLGLGGLLIRKKRKTTDSGYLWQSLGLRRKASLSGLTES